MIKMKNTIRPLFGFMLLIMFTFAMSSCAKSEDRTWSESMYLQYTYQTYTQFEAFNQEIDPEDVDEALLNAAIFYETNKQRAAQKVSEFVFDAALSRAAQGHSNDMVSRDFFSHTSPIATKKELIDRVKLEGISTSYVGENIIQGFVIQIGEDPYYPPSTPGGDFTRADGSVIGMYNYSKFAAYLVTRWMNSPGHRRNILDTQFTKLGCGSAFYFDTSSNHTLPSMKCTQCFSN